MDGSHASSGSPASTDASGSHGQSEYGPLPPLPRRFCCLLNNISTPPWNAASFSIWSAPRAETFEVYGNLNRERGDVERAIEYYERASRAYDEAGISIERTELLEERALLGLKVGDLTAAQAQIDRLITARGQEKDERGFFIASLTRGRILIARGEYQEAHAGLSRRSSISITTAFTTTRRRPACCVALCDLHLG